METLKYLNSSKTGFYDLSVFKTKIELKRFFKECINNSFYIDIQHIPDMKSTREPRNKPDISIKNVLKHLDIKSHNVFINRKIQCKSENYFEAGFTTFRPSLYLFININSELALKIVEKYNLKMD
jgi:hypothetical protein